MYRKLTLLTVFTLLIAALAIPASAKQPADVASLVDAALSAKLHAGSQSEAALKAAPGQSSTKIAERADRLDEKLERIVAKWESLSNHPGKAIGLHALLAGCNPGQGKRVVFAHSEHHRFVACTTLTTSSVHSGPPGHDTAKANGDDDTDD